MPLLSLWLILSALLLAVALTRVAIGYAHRRGMLDQPGQRRSHVIPTPRGGGIGIVAAVLASVPLALLKLPGAWPASVVISFVVALLLVALVGWWDDHRSLGVLLRFAVQLVAAGLFSASLLGHGLAWWWLPLLIVAGCWSINLHNFMDGIDGLLAQQGIFVFVGFSLMAASVMQPALACASVCMAAACAGFWLYNRSPARIFMGDVGSGSLGLLAFAMTAMLWQIRKELLWPALILCSSFVIDASLTLLVRVWRGRRWYNSHREHLYQWMVRTGQTHAQTGAYYLGWNLFVALPLALFAMGYPRMALPICIVAYAATSAAWLALKHRLLRRDLHKVRHVSQ